ncbi:riboflavin synthase [Trichophyton mentagrophytes]|nr:riboflavin synthase [Trichophyton mentagrophytes]
MFTGLVEKVGTVTALDPQDDSSTGGGGTSLTISDCAEILTDTKLGDSICVNAFDKSSFKVGVAPETLRRTNLGSLKAGSPVNLERSVLATTRMGGHFVQGHVDTTAELLSVTPDGNSLVLRMQPKDRSLLRYVVEKGFIALDGASLTITKVKDGEDGWWEVMLIAYTQEKVVTSKKKPGDSINVEIDLVGKYVEKTVQGYFEGQTNGDSAALEKMVDRLVEKKLQSMKKI